MFFRKTRFNLAWDATIAVNNRNNTYPVWFLKLFVALMGFRLQRDWIGGWEFNDR